MKENSTVTYSVGGLILSNSGAITANYWLSEIYDEEVANAHRNGDMHIHDLSMLTGYCAGWSVQQLINEGLGGIRGKTTSAPAKHLATLCNQMVNFLGIMQNEWAGAQAFCSFDTYLAPFVRMDGLNQDQVQKCIESFIFGVNTPIRKPCSLRRMFLNLCGSDYLIIRSSTAIYTIWRQLQPNPQHTVWLSMTSGNIPIS